MKIIFLTPEFPPFSGGIGYYVFYLTHFLLEYGVEPIVLIRGKKDRFRKQNGVDIYEIGCPGVAPLNSFIVKWKMERIIKNFKADICHIHASTMPWIESRTPVIVTAHSCAVEATGRFHRPIKDSHSLYRNLLLPIYKTMERI